MVIEFITEFLIARPRTGVIILAVLVSFFISLVNFFVLDKDRMREIKGRQKALQEEMKKHKGNHEKMMELQKEMFSHMGETFKQSFKPMLITIIPLLLLFPLMRDIFLQTDLGNWWLLYYILASIVASTIWRKVFRLP